MSSSVKTVSDPLISSYFEQTVTNLSLFSFAFALMSQVTIRRVQVYLSLSLTLFFSAK